MFIKMTFLIFGSLLLGACASGDVADEDQALGNAPEAATQPRQLELDVCLAMRSGLLNSPGNDEIPPGLSGDKLAAWSADNQSKAAEFERNLVESIGE